jgi:hypothetical protein
MNIRRITSLTALLSFIIILTTSAILYIVPQGRIAYWADWRLWGLTKDQWTNIHTINGLLFLISMFLHIYYNWNPILTYLKNKAKELKVFTKEFNVALVFTMVFTLGTLLELPPFQWVLDISANIKDAAAEKYGEPPYGHAELSTLRTLAKKQGFDLAAGLEELRNAGIRFDNEKQTLRDIARQNRMSPQQIYLAMKTEPSAAVSAGKNPDEQGATAIGQQPMGLGKMTVAEVCETYQLDQATALKLLADNGIKAAPDDKLKQVAQKHGTTPFDLIELMK